MKKLQKKNKKKIITYTQLLKNNFLNENQFKLKILYEKIFLFKRIDYNIIEFNESKQLLIPFTLITYNTIATFKSEFNKHLFFNYSLNYFLLINFNKLLLNIFYLTENQILSGRFLKRTYKYTQLLFYLFGIVLSIRTNNFNLYIHKLMTNKFLFIKHNPKRIRITKFFKLTRGKKLIQKYVGKSLHFKIIEENKKIYFSRREYINLMNKQNRKMQKLINELYKNKLPKNIKTKQKKKYGKIYTSNKKYF